MSCYCAPAKTHFADTDKFGQQKGACGRRYQLGSWTNEERMVRDPFWGSDGKFCAYCLKWLKKNRPDVLDLWEMAKDLRRKQFDKLKECPRELTRAY